MCSVRLIRKSFAPPLIHAPMDIMMKVDAVSDPQIILTYDSEIAPSQIAGTDEVRDRSSDHSENRHHKPLPNS